jgi:hypothetical protein
LFVLLVLVVGGVAVLGFYRGWFDVQWERSGGQGQLTGTVHEDKIKEDRARAAEKVEGLGQGKANAQTRSTKE